MTFVSFVTFVSSVRACQASGFRARTLSNLMRARSTAASASRWISTAVGPSVGLVNALPATVRWYARSACCNASSAAAWSLCHSSQRVNRSIASCSDVASALDAEWIARIFAYGVRHPSAFAFGAEYASSFGKARRTEGGDQGIDAAVEHARPPPAGRSAAPAARRFDSVPTQT